jgi:hypothetical protein
MQKARHVQPFLKLPDANAEALGIDRSVADQAGIDLEEDSLLDSEQSLGQPPPARPHFLHVLFTKAAYYEEAARLEKGGHGLVWAWHCYSACGPSATASQ